MSDFFKDLFKIKRNADLKLTTEVDVTVRDKLSLQRNFIKMLLNSCTGKFVQRPSKNFVFYDEENDSSLNSLPLPVFLSGT